VVRARDAKTFALIEREQAAFDTLGKYTRGIQQYNRLEVVVIHFSISSDQRGPYPA